MSNYHKHDVFPRYVDHSYHDFSSFIEDGGIVEKHKKSDRNFPALLHTMLSNDQYSHMISWMPHGRAWKVKDKDLLMKEAVPLFFGQSKYPSFLRQLSMWGFKRLNRTGPDYGCYYHECFLRGKPRLTPLMLRVSSRQGRASPNIHDEPNFYRITEQFPLPLENETSPEAEAEAEVPDRDNQRDLKVAETETSVSVSGCKKPECLGDFNPYNEVAGSGYEDDDDLVSTRKGVSPITITQSPSNSNQDEWGLFPFDHDHEVDHSAHPNHPEAKAAPESAMNRYAGAKAGSSADSFSFQCENCKKRYDDCGQEFAWSYCEGCWVYYCEDCKLGVEGINAIQCCSSCESNYCGECRVSKCQSEGENNQWSSPTDCAGCIQIAGPFLLEENKKVRKENAEMKAENKEVKDENKELKRQNQNGKGKAIGYEYGELMLEMKELKEKMLEMEELKEKFGALEEKLESMAIW